MTDIMGSPSNPARVTIAGVEKDIEDIFRSPSGVIVTTPKLCRYVATYRSLQLTANTPVMQILGRAPNRCSTLIWCSAQITLASRAGDCNALFTTNLVESGPFALLSETTTPIELPIVTTEELYAGPGNNVPAPITVNVIASYRQDD